MQHQTLDKRELLAAEIISGPRLVSVEAGSGSQIRIDETSLVNRLDTAPRELTFRFDGTTNLDGNTLAGIRILGSGGDGSFAEGNETLVQTGFLGFADDEVGQRVVVARFVDALPDDRYRIEIAGYDQVSTDPARNVTALRNTDGNAILPADQINSPTPSLDIDFEVEVGARVVAVVPQPVSGSPTARLQARNEIHVYFNDDPLSNPFAGNITSEATPGPGFTTSSLSVVNPSFYRLFAVADTVETTDDTEFLPTAVRYEPALNRVTLDFGMDIGMLLVTDPLVAPNGVAATFRLRIGSDQSLPVVPVIQNVPTESAGGDNTFATAIDVPMTFDPTAGIQSVLFDQASITNTGQYVPPWPGAYTAPGSRDQRRDSSLTQRVDTTTGINIFPYNFAQVYGTAPQTGSNLDQAITDIQRQRIREILDLYEQHLGVRFVETENSGLQIVNGDIRGVQQTADTGAGEGTPYSLFRVNERDPTRGVLVFDAGEPWYDGYGLSPDNRPSFFVEGLRGVGNLLGIGDLFELPDGVAAGGSSPDEPNSEGFSLDGDFSGFAGGGAFGNFAGFPSIRSEPDFLSQSDITLGQALHRPESSDVDFYNFTIDGDETSDAIMGRVTLETFAQRLDDVSLLDTQIQLYRIEIVRDETGTEIDRFYQLIARNDDMFSDDSLVTIDLSAGQYVVGISSTGNDSYDGQLDGTGTGGRTEGHYQLRVTFDGSFGETADNTITDANGTRFDGDADGAAGGNFNFWFRTAPDVARAAGAPATAAPRTIFVSKDNDGSDSPSAIRGQLNTPFRTVSAALASGVARPGDIVRLLPAQGDDNNIDTQLNNRAYEFGTGGANDAILSDGQTFAVPQGVTVMIDAGSILKFRDSKIVVGSESVDADRSLAAIQVLGIPGRNVFFTSYDDETLGIDTNPITTTPEPGNWAGIEIRNDVDYDEGRGVWEAEGIFLDYVGQADIRYGGGRIDIREPAVSPIQLDEARPTLIHNTITLSADAAISADPNSFREDNFNAPRYQKGAVFTSDYARVGPEIYGNIVRDNTTNALFVRVETPTGGGLEQMTVSGRFDDTDIVHVISEVLTIAGNPGGPVLLEARPTVASVTRTTPAGGTLPAGTYEYKLSYVTVEGSESLLSVAFARTTTTSTRSIRLNNLPVAPAGFVGRNLYRGTVGAGGLVTYELIEQLDRSSRIVTDSGQATRGAPIFEVVPFGGGVNNIGVAVAGTPGTLLQNRTYNYRITFGDEFGGETSASGASTSQMVAQDQAIRLTNLPTPPDGFVSTNVYRLNPGTSVYTLIAELRFGETTLLDDGRDVTVDGSLVGRVLGATATGGSRLLPRFDARLTIDPDIIVKFLNSRIEATFGADFYAEGSDGKPIVFTSRNDDEYGVGGTFDTNGDGVSTGSAGDWGGIMLRQGVSASLDFVDLRYGGGEAAIEGGTALFNALEILQADVRVTNSSFVANASGVAASGATTDIRVGRGFNDDATIFVRGAQPIIAGNVIVDGEGAGISINPDALNFHDVTDWGRSTGEIDRLAIRADNQGPLVIGNELSGNFINGMRVRGEIVTTDSVWDDTDIVHVVEEAIYSLTHHYYGALRLRSEADQSLVVKFGPNGTLIGGGRPLDIDDRIGGTLQVLGAPGFPVVLTSLNDNTIGAGFTPDGIYNTETLRIDDPNTPLVETAVPPTPGSWIGLQLQSYINDRNVAYVFESERAEPGAITTNSVPNRAQRIGALAASEFTGDENQRLGITVRGTLATPEDADVFRFEASGGTPVTFDIDETSAGLDTRIELITELGQVIASSNNSAAEAIGNEAIFVEDIAVLPQGILPADARSLLTGLDTGNVESANPLDAGFRIVLPGDPTESRTYYLRVSTPDQLTRGQYELSLRLDAQDEVAGSTVRGADIRFAQTAIDVTGAPLHSPLVGDTSEGVIVIDPTPGDANSGDEVYRESVDTRLNANPATAQPLGNLLTTDRGSLVVTGEIGNLNNSLSSPILFNSLLDERLEDVDVYRVDLFSQQLSPDVFDSENRYVTTTFDIDYAGDEFGRVNTFLSVYDALGRLILVGRDSNIADDQGRPTQGVDTANLSGGSSAVSDAYIGPVELPEGTYFVAVSSEAAVPQVLNQFFEANPVQPDVRLMPLNSVRRLSRDSFEEDLFASLDLGRVIDYTAERPILEPAFSTTSPVAYDLNDLRLFVAYDNGVNGPNSASLVSINPFTGVIDRLIGQSVRETGDLAMRRDGELYSYGVGVQPGELFNNANVGRYLNVNPTDASAGNIGDDGITFRRSNAAGTNTEVFDGAQFINSAIAFQRIPVATPTAVNQTAVTDGRNERMWVLGRRDDFSGFGFGRGGEIPIGLGTNILYQADAFTGEITSFGSEDGNADVQFPNNLPYVPFLGPASDEREFGVVDTGLIDTTQGKDGGIITGMAFPSGQGLFGTMTAVTDQGGIHTFNPFGGGPAPAGTIYEGYNQVIETTYFQRLTAHPEHGTANTDPVTGERFPIFSGLTYGPQTTEGGIYSDVLFGSTPDGWLYAFRLGTDTDGTALAQPANIFYNGRSAIPMTFVTGAGVPASTVGLAFSNLEVNPWHVTGDRFEDEGHGQVTPYDLSRQPLSIGGGSSLYFGFEINADTADNTVARPDEDPLGQISPGGVHGSVISEAFDLREYSAADRPSLYFTYYIEVEANDDYLPGVRQQRDSLRVFASGDDGQWQLLATNNEFRALPLLDEYDEFGLTNIPVQTVFDDNPDNQWRQVRADLSPLAGSRNVKLRFDFSTGGAIQAHFNSIELVGADGETIADNSLTYLIDDRGITSILQTIVGRDVVFPRGQDLREGQTVVITPASGPPQTIRFVSTLGLTGDVEVLIDVTDTPDEVATKVAAAAPAILEATADGAGRVSFLSATNVQVDATILAGQSNPVLINAPAGRQINVPNGVEAVEGEQIIVTRPGFPPITLTYVRDGNQTGAVGEVVFDSADTQFQIAQSIVNALPAGVAFVDAAGNVRFGSPATNAFIIAAPSQIIINVIPDADVRTLVNVRPGIELNDDERLTFNFGTPANTFTVAFDDGDGVPPALPADVVIPFSNADSATAIRDAILAVLPVALDGQPVGADSLSVLSNFNAGDDVVDQRPNLFTSRSINSFRIDMALASQLVAGEILTITVDGQTQQVIFDDSDDPSALGSVNYNGNGSAGPNTSVGEIARRLAQVALPAEWTIGLDGRAVVIYGNAVTVTTAPLSAIVATQFQALEITVPEGVSMNDRDTIRVQAVGPGIGAQVNTQELTLRERRTNAPPLPANSFGFDSIETATQLRDRLLPVLSATAVPGEDINGNPLPNILRVIGQALVIGTPAEGVAVALEPVTVIELPAGADLRTGEQLELVGSGGFVQVITFVREGTTLANPVGIEIPFNETLTAAEVGQRIVAQLQGIVELAVVETPTGFGLAVRGSSASVVSNPAATIVINSDPLNTYAIPITLPSGAQLLSGDSITVFRKDDPLGLVPPDVYTFRLAPSVPADPNEVIYTLADSPADITSKLLAVLDPSLLPLPLGTEGRELQLVGASSVVVRNAPGSAADRVPVIRSFQAREESGLNPNNVRAVPVIIDSTLSAADVAQRLRRALVESVGVTEGIFDDFISTATPESFPLNGGDRVRLFNTIVTDPGPYGFNESLESDFFGVGLPTGFAANQINTAGAANNVIEGVYIDDIIVGLAERGEAVLYDNFLSLAATPPNANYVLDPAFTPDTRPDAIQPENPDEILVGHYSLEIRTADEYGVPQDYVPISLELDEDRSLGRSFDSNDRLANGAVTIVAPAGRDLIDGDRFVLDDGTRRLTFEFRNRFTPDDVESGNVEVLFDSTNLSNEIARAIRDAINSTQSQDTLQIVAATGDGRDLGASTSSRVELFGPNVFVNPGSGRNLRLDMTAEETFAGNFTSRRIALVDHAAGEVEYFVYGDELAQSAVPGYVTGDTLHVSGKIGDVVNIGVPNNVSADDGAILGSRPQLDVDSVRVFLTAGQSIDIDVDTTGLYRTGGGLEVPVVAVVRSGVAFTFANLSQNVLAGTSLTTPTFAVGESQAAAFLRFTPPEDGYYDVFVTSAISINTNFQGITNPFFETPPLSATDRQFGDYAMTIRPTGDAGVPDRDVLAVDYQFGKTDVNRVREQGQIVIEGNFIRDSSDTGIASRVGPAGQGFTTGPGGTIVPDIASRPGSARLLRSINPDGLIPGVVIVNNLVIDSGVHAIDLVGGDFGGNQLGTPNIFSRVVNNTLVNETRTGVGISVDGRSAPTLVNNVIVGFNIGIDVDTVTANQTIIRANLFSRNNNNATIPLVVSSIVEPDTVELFRNGNANGAYIPAVGSRLIDSSFASIQRREDFFVTVQDPVGIGESPIIAPSFDIYGQRRVDGVTGTPSGGTGLNIFVDRGAVDRSDFRRPVAILNNPFDAPNVDAAGSPNDPNTIGDTDAAQSFVRLVNDGEFVSFFEIQMIDEAGTGLDPATITSDTVLITENGRQLLPDQDFTFSYSANNRTIRLTPLAGVWNQDSVYEITLNNQDRLLLNLPDGGGIADGDQVTITDETGRETVFEFESGYTLGIPQLASIVVTDVRTGFVDTQTFSITLPSLTGPVTRTFEIDTSNITAPGNQSLRLGPTETIAQIRDEILRVILLNADALDLAPVAVGNDTIQLGALPGHVINFGTGIAGLNLVGTNNGTVQGAVVDGQQFSYSNDTVTTVFEFDNNGLPPATTESSEFRLIPFERTDTPDQIAAKVATILADSGFLLDNARSVGNGLVSVGGSPGDVLTLLGDTPAVGNVPFLTLSGQPGVTAGLTLTIPAAATGASIDNSPISLTVGGQTETFRFTTNPGLASPDRLIVLAAADNATAIAAALAAAIEIAFEDGVAPTSEDNVVTLNEIPSGQNSQFVTVNIPVGSPLGTVASVVDGVSGGAVPITFIPSSTFPAVSVAAQVQLAINNAAIGINVFGPGGGVLLIDGADSVVSDLVSTGVVTAQTIDAVADLAGNPVAPTRPNNETRFTIIMPEVEFDFGDAPRSYQTVLAAGVIGGASFPGNGARHAIVGGTRVGFGPLVDTERDGQPIGGDDVPTAIALNSASASLTVATPEATTRLLTIVAQPARRESFQLTIDGQTVTFEYIDNASNPTPGTTSILFVPLVPEVPATSTTPAVPEIPGSTPAQVAEATLREINAILNRRGGDVLASIDPAAPATIRIEAIDDEDGVPIVLFNDGVNPDPLRFFGRFGTDGQLVAPGVNTDAVQGFLNPLDPAGTNVNVNIFGSGLLNVWVDYNRDGDFDDVGEHAVMDSPVQQREGGVIVNLPQPQQVFSTTDNYDTWIRFRVNESGSLGPAGVAIGGEVEDYLVTVVPQDVQTAENRSYFSGEDTQLVVPSVTQDGLFDPSAGGTAFLPVRYNITVPEDPTLTPISGDPGDIIRVFRTANGRVEVNFTNGDDLNGAFTYIPNPDFYGIDTFTYRLSNQSNFNASLTDPMGVGTVTLNVWPENDRPGYPDNDADPANFNPNEPAFVVAEPTATNPSVSLTITELDLVRLAIPDFDPFATGSPQNESNQAVPTDGSVNNGIFVYSVRALNADGSGSPVTINQNDPQGNMALTVRGASLQTFFKTVTVDGFSINVIDRIVYTPAADFNTDATTVMDEFLLDSFTFTLVDNGQSILPDNLRDNLNANSSFIPAGASINGNVWNQLRAVPIRESAPATATIRVTPQNDNPDANDDVVAIAAAGGPASAFQDYLTANSLPIPVVGEDTPLVIPAGFLLANDFNGPVTAIDERGLVNDGDLRVIDVQMVDPNQGVVTFDSLTGEITFVPAADLFGEIVFTYTLEDSGIDESTNINPLTGAAIADPDVRGTRVSAPRVSIGRVTVTLDPVNDAPVAYDRTRRTAEDSDNDPSTPGTEPLVITAADLLAGLGNSPSQIVATTAQVILPDAAGFNEGETLILTATNGRRVVVEFNSTGTGSTGTDEVIRLVDGETAADIAVRLESVLRSLGFGSTATPTGVTFSDTNQANSVTVANALAVNSAAQTITLPSGGELVDGEILVVTDASGNAFSFVFTRSGVTNVPGGIAVPFTAGDTSQTLAETLAGIMRTNGFGAASAATTTTETRLQLLEATSVTSTSPQLRIIGDEVVLPSGAQLLAAPSDRLLFQTAGGVVTVEFRTDSALSDPSFLLVQYDLNDSANDIALALESVLRNADLTPSVRTLTDYRVTVTDIVAASLTLGTPSSLTISGTELIFPALSAIQSGETFSLTDGFGVTRRVELSATGIPTAGTDLLVQYNPAGTLANLLTSVANALRGVGIGAAVTANSVVMRSVNGLAVDLTDTNIAITNAATGVRILVPGGDELLDGERIRLTGVTGLPLVIEFNTTGILAPGVAAVVEYTAADDSDLIALKLQQAMRGLGVGSIADDEDRAIPAGRSLVTIQTINAARVGELTNRPGEFDPRLPSPFNEDDQMLRIVRFETDLGVADVSTGTASTVADGGQVVLSGTGGERYVFVVRVQTIGGISVRSFASISYEPPANYNEQLPFAPRRLVRYVIADDGPLPTSGVADPTLGARSNTGTLTLTVAPVNDGPVFELGGVNGLFNVLEVDGAAEDVVINNFVFNIFGGPNSASDEQGQNVSFSIQSLAGNDPFGIMRMDPVVLYTPGDATGRLRVSPVEDAFGTATYVLIGTDDQPGTLNPQTRVTFTINVLPVNDAPRINPTIANGAPIVAGDEDISVSDEAYRVSMGVDTNGDDELDQATITLNLREDNTQPTGDPNNPVTTGNYFIPLRSIDPETPTSGTYRRIGLLDIYTAGPANELVDPGVGFASGGPQQLRALVPTTTELGGTLTPRFRTGTGPGASPVLIGYWYTPPTDFNNRTSADMPFDSFSFQVEDFSTASGGESYVLGPPAQLVDDERRSTSMVRLNLQPVNDRPVFQTQLPLNQLRYEVAEDGPLQVINQFAFGIFAGPSQTAFDELNEANPLEFTITSLTFESATQDDFRPFFETLEITPNGRLNFQPSPNVFGTFEFEVVLTEVLQPGQVAEDNSIRGDLRSSVPVTLTIDVRPVNDRPVLNPDADPLDFQLDEGGTVTILVRGDGSTQGLLDLFNVGPDNEATNVVGGNQTLRLADPIPSVTAAGGTLEAVTENGEIVRFIYRPANNYVGPDSFTFTVSDNGVTVPVGGNGASQPAPRTTSGAVTFDVLPVNDAPQFSGAGNVASDEDEDQGAGPGVISITNWATNVQAGPPGANDENFGTNAPGGVPQTTSFSIQFLSGDATLFTTQPTAVVNADGNATLSYVTAPDANGSATFTVQLSDNGPRDLGNGDVFQSDVRTFTINVNATNDAPTFTPGGIVRVSEDRGPFSTLWADPRSTGPADEADQTLSFTVTPVTPADAALFAVTGQPTIDENGILRFTPAANRNGIALLDVRAVDSEDGVSESVRLQIVIQAVNDQPTAVGETENSDEDTVLVFTEAQLLANEIDIDLTDTNPDVLRLSMPLSQVSRLGALVTFDPVARTVTYDPRGADTLQARQVDSPLLEDSFQYRVVDLAGAASNPIRESNTVLVTVNIAGVNDAPRVGDDTPTLNEEGFTDIDVLANDIDIDGQISTSFDNTNPALQSPIITSLPALGSVAFVRVFDENGQPKVVVRYTPLSDFQGEDTFSYRVRDDRGLLSEEATVTISPNAAPVAVNDTAGLFQNEAIVINVVANDTETADDSINPNSIVISVPPRFGIASPNPDGTVTYQPAIDFTGVDSFEYTVADQSGRRSNAARVNLQVVASRLQNPVRFNDVNGNGEVSALDALLIINHLNAADSIPPDERTPEQDLVVTPEDRIGEREPGTGRIISPSFFYDTNGDLRITALDALRVINELNTRDRSGNGSGEPGLTNRRSQPASEPIVSAVDALLAASGSNATQDRGSAVARQIVSSPLEEVMAENAKRIGSAQFTDVPPDVLDALIGFDDDDETTSSDQVTAIDAAMSRLL